MHCHVSQAQTRKYAVDVATSGEGIHAGFL